MQVDIIIEPEHTPDTLVRMGQEAERLGIRCVWMSNYYAHWDPFLSLVPMAQQTTTRPRTAGARRR